MCVLWRAVVVCGLGLISIVSAFAAPDKPDFNQEIIKIADTVAGAYKSGEGSYRAISRDAFETNAREKSAKLFDALAMQPPENSSLKPLSKEQFIIRFHIMLFGPAITGLALDIARNPDHASWIGKMSAIYFFGFLYLTHKMPTSTFRTIIYAPELVWLHLKKMAKVFVRRSRSSAEARRIRVRLSKELESRGVPIDYSSELCGPLLSDKPMVRVEVAEFEEASADQRADESLKRSE